MVASTAVHVVVYIGQRRMVYLRVISKLKKHYSFKFSTTKKYIYRLFDEKRLNP
jgi:hypothetical protein